MLGLSLTSENYDEAVVIPKSRFGDPQIVIQTIMDVLLSLSNIESCSDICLLRKRLDAIETTSRNLRPSNIDSTHINLSRYEKITRGNSFRTFETNACRKVGPSASASDLLQLFSKKPDSKEQCQSIKSSESSSQIIGSQGLNSGSILHVASENHNRNPPKITCTYCRKNRPSNRVVTDVLARKKILQDKSKCYNSLKTGHSVKNGTSQHRCFTCKRKHYISICESKINPL